MDWQPWAEKVALAVGGAIASYVLPRALRAWRNRHKTRAQIATEELERAIADAKAAHANSDPSDDAAADARVDQARRAAHAAREGASFFEGLAGE